MRMIDADALLERIENPYQYKEVARWVNDMPTIEPKKGKWIKHAIGHEHTPWGYDCSECGEWFVVGEEVIKKYKYCPNCGCSMKGETDERN